MTWVEICAVVVGGGPLNSVGSMRTTGDPLSINIPKDPGSSSIMFIEALTKIRLPAMSAVAGSPSVPIVVIPEVRRPAGCCRRKRGSSSASQSATRPG